MRLSKLCRQLYPGEGAQKSCKIRGSLPRSTSRGSAQWFTLKRPSFVLLLFLLSLMVDLRVPLQFPYGRAEPANDSISERVTPSSLQRRFLQRILQRKNAGVSALPQRRAVAPRPTLERWRQRYHFGPLEREGNATPEVTASSAHHEDPPQLCLSANRCLSLALWRCLPRTQLRGTLLLKLEQTPPPAPRWQVSTAIDALLAPRVENCFTQQIKLALQLLSEGDRSIGVPTPTSRSVSYLPVYFSVTAQE